MTRAQKTWYPVTKASIDALQPHPVRLGRARASAIYDAYFAAPAPAGFHVRVFPGGRKLFALRYRDPAGGTPPRYLRYAIGEYGRLTLHQGLALANDIRARIDRGEKPHDDKRARAKIPKVSQVVSDYVAELRRTRKPRYAAETARILAKHVASTKLGRELIAAVTGRDLQQLHASLSETPVEANRLIAALSGLFSFAIRRGDLTTNPATAVTKTPETPRDVEPLTDAQVAALGDALRTAEQAGQPWQPLQLIRFLFFTGCRRNEAVQLRWAEIDEERARVLFLDSKGTKRGMRRTDRRPLGAPVLELLSDIKARGVASPYVFPSPADPTQPYANLDRHWQRIRTAAGLPTLRLHDLRHDVASDFGMRFPGAVVQAMAGHANMATTSRYIHAKDGPMTRAADTVTGDRLKRLNAKPLHAPSPIDLHHPPQAPQAPQAPQKLKRR